MQRHKKDSEPLLKQQEIVVAAVNTDESQDVLSPHEVNAENRTQWGCSKSTLKHSQPAFTIDNPFTDIEPIADGIPWGVSSVQNITSMKDTIIDDTAVMGFTTKQSFLQGKNHAII